MQPQKQESGLSGVFARALIGLLPTVVGAAFGGDEGAAVGADVGVKALGQYTDAELTQQKMAQDQFQANQALMAQAIKEDQGNALQSGLQEDKQKHDFALAGFNAKTAKEALVAASEIDAAKRRFSQSSELRSSFNKEKSVESMSNIYNQYNKTLQSFQSKTGISDQALVYAVAKSFDDTSGVKEGEAQTVLESAGVSEKVKGLVKQYMGDGKLSDTARLQLMQEMGNQLRGAQTGYKEKADAYKLASTRYNLNPSDVIMNDLSNYQTKDFSSEIKKFNTEQIIKQKDEARKAKNVWGSSKDFILKK